MENLRDSNWAMLAKVLSHEADTVVFDDFDSWLSESYENQDTYSEAKYIWSAKKPVKDINKPFDSVIAFARLDKKIRG